MFRTTLFVAAAAALAASCTKDSAATTSQPQDVASRLARLEKRLDKVVEVLESKLGPPDPDPEAMYAVPIDPRDPVEGPADAKVTVVEGFEFACPYCYEAYPIVEQLQQAFPEDVRVVTKYMVVHEPAVPAGLASCAAAKQGKFPELKRAIWTESWGPDGPIVEKLTPETMEAYAAAAGMDVAKFKKDMRSDDCQDWLIKSEDTLHGVGQSGTPGFYVNGRALGGLVPLEDLKKIVAEELAKADQAIAGGVAQKDFYQKVVVGTGVPKVRGWFDVD